MELNTWADTCIIFSPVKYVYICCHEKHWTKEQLLKMAEAEWGTPWDPDICSECVLGECPTAIKRRNK